MRVTVTEDPQPDIARCARRTARRLLSGAGSADLTAYRIDPSAPIPVAHALRADGCLLIAACPASGTPLAGLDRPVEVRLDITMDAADPGIRITVASAHLLGTLRWADETEAAALLASTRTPACHCAITGEHPIERVAAIADHQGGRLGVITADRFLLHGPSGISGHAIADILDIEAPQAGYAWGAVEALTAHEAVTAVGQIGLHAICDAVREGASPGWICSTRPAIGVCPSLRGKVLCLDVDEHGATLMQITGEEVTTAVIVFPDGPILAHDTGDVLERLAAEILPPRLMRP